MRTEDESLNKYLKEIGNTELITIEDEIRLAKEIKKGNKRALDQLVKSNLRFVVSTAKKYRGQGLSLADLINEGNLGLIKAAQRFDETKGFKFISYAVWWIRQAILEALSTQTRTVRLPLNKIQEINTITKFISQFETAHGSTPDIHEISKETGLAPERIQSALEESKRDLSLHSTSSNSEKSSLIDFVINEKQELPDQTLMLEAENETILAVLNSLTERESKVVQLYYGINHERAYTLEEIGDMFGLTRERIRQVKEKALTKLRHTSRSSNLKFS